MNGTNRNSLGKRWAKESLGLIMAGDAMITLVDPQRHCRLWMKGPAAWRSLVNVFVKHPLLTRGIALAELGLGVWLAEKQEPVKLEAGSAG